MISRTVKENIFKGKGLLQMPNEYVSKREPERYYNWFTGIFKENKYIDIKNAEMNLQINVVLGYFRQSSPLQFHGLEESFREKKPFTLLSVFNLDL